MVVWSPCSKFIAVAEFATVEIFDVVILKRFHTFETSLGYTTCYVGVSPDSCILTQFNAKGNLASWDLQTGGPVGAILSELDFFCTYFSSSTYSLDRKILAVSFRNPGKKVITTLTYNLLSGAHATSYHISGERPVTPVWTRRMSPIRHRKIRFRHYMEYLPTSAASSSRDSSKVQSTVS